LDVAFQSLPGLRHFVFDARTLWSPKPESGWKQNPARIYVPNERLFHHSSFVPSILRTALEHPTLLSFSSPYFEPDWFSHPSLPLTPRPSDRPLSVPTLKILSNPHYKAVPIPPRWGSHDSFEPILRSLVHHHFHVNIIDLHFDLFSSDLLFLAQTPLLHLDTLRLRITDSISALPNAIPLFFPPETLQLVAASHPNLRTISAKVNTLNRATVDLLWSLLSSIAGFECIVNSREESWRSTDQIAEDFKVEFTGEDGDGRRTLWGMTLKLFCGGERMLPMTEVLEGVGKHFVNLQEFKLDGTFERPTVSLSPPSPCFSFPFLLSSLSYPVLTRFSSYGSCQPGQLRVPDGLFPNLQSLTLPAHPSFLLVPHGDFRLSLSSCPHHPHQYSTSSDNPPIIINSRDQDLADVFNSAGGPVSLWKQEILPRITSDIVRLGEAFLSLTTVHQHLNLDPSLRAPLVKSANFAWTISSIQGGAGAGKVRATLWGGSGVAMGSDEVGWCSCGGRAGKWDGEDNGRRLLWWLDGFEKTPLFELEPNFAPAFYLDKYFPKIPRPSRLM